MSTENVLCRLCGHRHRLGGEHVYDKKRFDVDKEVRKLIKKQEPPLVARVHEVPIPGPMGTVTTIGITEWLNKDGLLDPPKKPRKKYGGRKRVYVDAAARQRAYRRRKEGLDGTSKNK